MELYVSEKKISREDQMSIFGIRQQCKGSWLLFGVAVKPAEAAYLDRSDTHFPVNIQTVETSFSIGKSWPVLL